MQAEHAREKELREGPHFTATVEQLARRIGDTQAALDSGKASLREKVPTNREYVVIHNKSYNLHLILGLNCVYIFTGVGRAGAAKPGSVLAVRLFH